MKKEFKNSIIAIIFIFFIGIIIIANNDSILSKMLGSFVTSGEAKVYAAFYCLFFACVMLIWTWQYNKYLSSKRPFKKIPDTQTLESLSSFERSKLELIPFKDFCSYFSVPLLLLISDCLFFSAVNEYTYFCGLHISWAHIGILVLFLFLISFVYTFSILTDIFGYNEYLNTKIFNYKNNSNSNKHKHHYPLLDRDFLVGFALILVIIIWLWPLIKTIFITLWDVTMEILGLHEFEIDPVFSV